jgi:hypothetical protein
VSRYSTMYTVSWFQELVDLADTVAGQYFKSHRHVFDKTHPLVRDAVEGDRLVLWARAEYPVCSVTKWPPSSSQS